ILPRALFPTKPLENLGQVFGHTYGLLEPSDYKTSVNMFQTIEMYVNYGATGVMVGMFLLGIVYAGLGSLIAGTCLLEWGEVAGIVVLGQLINIEANLSGVLGGVLYTILVLWVLGRVVTVKTSTHML